MLFNSIQFGIFFLIVYFFYLLLRHKWQNRMLLIASYVFYGSWDWRFLSLIFISTIVDYFTGLKIHNSQSRRRKKIFLVISIVTNLSILGFFKYFNFFSENLEALFSQFGFAVEPRFLNIILPVGISFYTFQTMSYTIDIYRGKLEPTRKFFDFALFVAFFPQLVAGPIERAKRLLPQILSSRSVTLEKFTQGSYLIFWGLFQKIFIADNLARFVDPVFSTGPPYEGAMVVLATYAFAFQIFCDFAGYSNIARGLGKLMGFDIMVNFNIPYIATNPSEFWRRWHISLSTWLRDYLYIPLGGNRKGSFNTYRNLALTMLLGGLWHGAAWTFVIWGAYQGLLLIVHRLLEPLMQKTSVPRGLIAEKLWFGIKVFFFFNLVCFGWLIFRAQSLEQVAQMTLSIFTNFNIIQGIGLKGLTINLIIYTWFMLLIHFLVHKKENFYIIFKFPIWLRTAIYLLIYFSIVIMGAPGEKEFIYFQF